MTKPEGTPPPPTLEGTRFFWVGEHAAPRTNAPCYLAADPHCGSHTSSIHAAKQCASKQEAEEWIAAKAPGQFEAREHGIMAPPPTQRMKQGQVLDGLRLAISWMRNAVRYMSSKPPPGPPSYPTRHDAELIRRLTVLADAPMSGDPAKHSQPPEQEQEELRTALRELREVQESGDMGEETGSALNAVEHRLLALLPPGEPWPIPPPSGEPSPDAEQVRALREALRQIASEYGDGPGRGDMWARDIAADALAAAQKRIEVLERDLRTSREVIRFHASTGYKDGSLARDWLDAHPAASAVQDQEGGPGPARFYVDRGDETLLVVRIETIARVYRWALHRMHAEMFANALRAALAPPATAVQDQDKREGT